MADHHFHRKISITQLQEDDRPREKFESRGPAALTTAELFAILIGSGSTDENAVSLMQRLMNDCEGSLAKLGRMSIKELCSYKGVGPAKAITILAACELGKRRMKEKPIDARILKDSSQIAEYFRGHIEVNSVEEAHVLLLNQRLELIATKLISRGGITGTVVDIRLVLKEALLSGATAMILCHNHPSGSRGPSSQDNSLTKRLKEAGEKIDIHLIDHIIVTDHNHFSYHDEGCL